MKNKVVLVTGGSGGIGKEIVKTLASQQMIVCLQYSQHKEKALAISKNDKNIYLFKQDFLSKKIIIIDKIIEKFGRLDCLINCAGIMAEESFFEMTSKGFDKIFTVNTKIPFILSAQAFKVMKDNNYGRIINISSFVIKYGMGRNKTIQYAGSKAALECLTTGLARLGAEYNILVNTIRPGVINTEMQKDRSDIQARINMIPVKRMGTPEEVASLVSFLLSESANYITGQTITISGGE